MIATSVIAIAMPLKNNRSARRPTERSAANAELCAGVTKTRLIERYSSLLSAPESSELLICFDSAVTPAVRGRLLLSILEVNCLKDGNRDLE